VLLLVKYDAKMKFTIVLDKW